MNQRLIPLSVGAVIFALDRATKLWIDAHLSAFDTWIVIPGFFNIIHAENRGMAFSLLDGASKGWREFLLIGVSTVVLIFVAVMLWQATQRLQYMALSLVLGGAIGNLYDRIARGSVTDFLDVYVGDYHWPTFNAADSAITIGALILALSLWTNRKGPVPS